MWGKQHPYSAPLEILNLKIFLCLSFLARLAKISRWHFARLVSHGSQSCYVHLSSGEQPRGRGARQRELSRARGQRGQRPRKRPSPCSSSSESCARVPFSRFALGTSMRLRRAAAALGGYFCMYIQTPVCNVECIVGVEIVSGHTSYAHVENIHLDKFIPV